MSVGFNSKLLYTKDINCGYREFNSKASAEQWGDDIYGDWITKYKSLMQKVKHLDKMSPYSKQPVEAFCGYGFSQLNSYLRDTNYVNDSSLQAFADVLQLAIYSAPSIPENIVVYRLVCDKVIEDLLTKTNTYTYYERGFLSASLYEKFYHNQNEHYVSHKNLLKIYVNKGTHAIFASGIDYRSECEMLFLPGITLALIKKPYKKSGKTIYECFMPLNN